MRPFVIQALLWFSALTCAVLGGVYFAFSTFVMRALGATPAAIAVVTMNSINTVIVKSTFMPFFFASTLSCGLLAAIALLNWSKPTAPAVLIGGALYVVGMLGTTMFFNVPLNNALAGFDATPAAAAFWTRYLDEWVWWNYVRMLASIGAATLFVYSLTKGGLAR